MKEDIALGAIKEISQTTNSHTGSSCVCAPHLAGSGIVHPLSYEPLASNISLPKVFLISNIGAGEQSSKVLFWCCPHLVHNSRAHAVESSEYHAEMGGRMKDPFLEYALKD